MKLHDILCSSFEVHLFRSMTWLSLFYLGYIKTPCGHHIIFCGVYDGTFSQHVRTVENALKWETLTIGQQLFLKKRKCDNTMSHWGYISDHFT